MTDTTKRELDREEALDRFRALKDEIISDPMQLKSALADARTDVYMKLVYLIGVLTEQGIDPSLFCDAPNRALAAVNELAETVETIVEEFIEDNPDE